MKLVVAIVQGEDAGRTAQALNNAGLSVTKLASSGGFLQQGNATLLIGVDEDRVDQVSYGDAAFHRDRIASLLRVRLDAGQALT